MKLMYMIEKSRLAAFVPPANIRTGYALDSDFVEISSTSL